MKGKSIIAVQHPALPNYSHSMRSALYCATPLNVERSLSYSLHNYTIIKIQPRTIKFWKRVFQQFLWISLSWVLSKKQRISVLYFLIICSFSKIRNYQINLFDWVETRVKLKLLMLESHLDSNSCLVPKQDLKLHWRLYHSVQRKCRNSCWDYNIDPFVNIVKSNKILHYPICPN